MIDVEYGVDPTVAKQWGQKTLEDSEQANVVQIYNLTYVKSEIIKFDECKTLELTRWRTSVRHLGHLADRSCGVDLDSGSRGICISAHLRIVSR